MTVWPVIERELRAEARHPFNYWVRVLAASAVSIVFALIIWDQPGSPAELGARLFSTLNATVFVTIWILVPLLISDCISREKREGTLGLLFLTPLTSGGIVLGKSLIHGLRASTLFLAALPVLALPFLLGGVTWQNAAFALLLNLVAMLLAMAAGLLASSWAKDWARAYLGEAFSLILVSLLSSIHRLGYIYLQITLAAMHLCAAVAAAPCPPGMKSGMDFGAKAFGKILFPWSSGRIFGGGNQPLCSKPGCSGFSFCLRSVWGS